MTPRAHATPRLWLVDLVDETAAHVIARVTAASPDKAQYKALAAAEESTGRRWSATRCRPVRYLIHPIHA